MKARCTHYAGVCDRLVCQRDEAAVTGFSWESRGAVAELMKVHEPSRIRRGRASTVPTWYVRADDGSRWSFQRKRDARAFMTTGCVAHCEDLFSCKICRGFRVEGPPNG